MDRMLEDAGPAEDVVERTIVHDGTLPRYSADTAVSTFLGRDIEIALLTYTVRLETEVAKAIKPDDRAIRVSSELLEIARVRISPAGARQMAMGLLTQLLEAEYIEADRLKADIEDMIETYSTDVHGGTL